MKPLPAEDPEIKRLMRPLCPEEFQQLKENILADKRVTQPLVVWKEKNILIDGYHRLKIIQLNPEVKWDTIELSFPDRLAVNRWVLGHQLGRRNLSGGAIHMARVALLTSADDKTIKGVADELNVSTKTVQRASEYVKMLDEVPLDIRNEIADGARPAGMIAVKRLLDLDDEMREVVYDRMRKDKSKALVECLPVLKKVKPYLGEELPDLSGVSKVKLRNHGGADEKSIKKFASLSPTQKMVVDDVIATDGAGSLGEAIALVESPRSKPKLPPDISRMNDKVNGMFSGLIDAINELAVAHGCSDGSDHKETIDMIQAARSRFSTWSGVLYV